MEELTRFCHSELDLIKQRIENVLEVIDCNRCGQGQTNNLVREPIELFKNALSIDSRAVIELLDSNLQRWQTHLESTLFDVEQESRMKNDVDDFIKREMSKLNGMIDADDTTELTQGRFLEYTKKNRRKLPIVGNVYYRKMEWPYTT